MKSAFYLKRNSNVRNNTLIICDNTHSYKWHSILIFMNIVIIIKIGGVDCHCDRINVKQCGLWWCAKQAEGRTDMKNRRDDAPHDRRKSPNRPSSWGRLVPFARSQYDDSRHFTFADVMYTLKGDRNCHKSVIRNHSSMKMKVIQIGDFLHLWRS